MNNCRIRKFRIEDIPRLRHFKIFNEITEHLCQHSSLRRMCLVAVCGELPIGYILGEVDKLNCLTIHHIEVEDSHRLQGVGRALVEELERRSRAQTCLIYHSKDLHDFYEKLGYCYGDKLEVAIRVLGN